MPRIVLKPPFVTFGQCPGGGLGMLLKCRDANGVSFAAKFPKDSSYASQQMLDDEERRIQRHQGDHIVIYYGSVHHSDGRRGFAMELMEGSLADLVRTDGALPRPRAIALIWDAAKGLASVHRSARGAYHGDLKLANILLRGQVAKLADFGLARGGVGQTQYAGPHRGGTPGYFPPEGFTSTAGDIYSLGVALWAMLVGREPTVPGPALAPQPRQLQLLLNGMLARDLHARFRIDQVLQQMTSVAAESPDRSWLKKLAVGAGAGAILLGLLNGRKQ